MTKLSYDMGHYCTFFSFGGEVIWDMVEKEGPFRLANQDNVNKIRLEPVNFNALDVRGSGTMMG